jgi:hypothetical protein
VVVGRAIVTAVGKKAAQSYNRKDAQLLVLEDDDMTT